MQNMKSYFSSWKNLWKSSKSSATRTLTLAPSTIHFTDSSLGDLKYSIIDEKLMIDISTKLIESVCPPKLQVCAHNNQWFALNNSHLLVYRQLERIGLCDAIACDIIRSQDIPSGIRQTLISVPIPQTELDRSFQNLQEPCSDHGTLSDDEGAQSQDEVIYRSDVQADSCGYFEGEDPYDSSVVTNGESDRDEDSDDEASEWPIHTRATISTISHQRFDHIDLDDDAVEDSHKELQSLLPL